MAETLDFRGLRCPAPVLKASIKIQSAMPGTLFEVMADCPEFEDQIREWCSKSGRVLVNLVNNGKYKTATVRA